MLATDLNINSHGSSSSRTFQLCSLDKTNFDLRYEEQLRTQHLENKRKFPKHQHHNTEMSAPGSFLIHKKSRNMDP